MVSSQTFPPHHNLPPSSTLTQETFGRSEVGLFSRKAKEVPPLDRIASSLERIALLYELDLISQGIVTRTGTEEGEVLETDPNEIAKQEYLDELRELHGVAKSTYPSPVRPDGRGWKLGDNPSGQDGGEDHFSFFPTSWGFPVGPEGAEEAFGGPEAERSPAGGTSGVSPGRRGAPESEGEGGADRGEEA